MYKYNLGISFEEIVEKHCDRVALKFSKMHTISYKELNKKANQLARYFLDTGINQKDVVCISGDKKVSTFACMIACLKIGAVYTIIDPESPVERLRKIIMTCLPKLLFVEPQLGKRICGINKGFNQTIVINTADEFENTIKAYNHTNLKETRRITGKNPAYIMFTSGSTGIPKGALMTHSNVLNFIDWSIETYNISFEDVLTNVNPLYFDNSVFDFYSSLFSGACLVPFLKDTVVNPKLFIDLIDELKCTSWFSVPTLLIFLQTMKAFNINNMKYIRRYIFGGEGYPKAKLKKLYDIYYHRAEFFNVYGPTECTCICSSYKITEDDFNDLQGLPPLGSIIDNFSFLILDDNNKMVPSGEGGELCLLGPHVGKGYYNDYERTYESFVQNPFNNEYKEFMYKTGDFVKLNGDDEKIYFMSRKDNQIKHMGYRIELEEIEAALGCLEYISQAAVFHGTIRGLSQIIAVVSSKNGNGPKQIRDDLKGNMPDYMIPTKMHIIGELPRNPNGKVDRQKLREIYLETK